MLYRCLGKFNPDLVLNQWYNIVSASEGRKEVRSMSYNIFLSHNEADKQLVQLIYENANSIGVSVYMYEHDSQPGVTIAPKIQAAIDNTQALVVLLTDNSQFSPYVQQEIGYAEAKGKLVIPLVQPGVSQKCLAMLDGKEYIAFDPWNPEIALSQLLEYLQKLKQGRENDQAILFGIGTLVVLALLSKK